MMNYADYLAGISFRFVKPYVRMPMPADVYDERLKRIVEKGRTGLLERIGMGLEYINTVIPEHGGAMKRRLWEVCGIPKMSTLAIGAMINRGVAQMPKDHAFVNVGVWHGFTLLSAMTDNGDKKCVGIDNFSQFGGPREIFLERFNRRKGPDHQFYDMDYRDYFAGIHQGPIGFYIYDGDHDYEHQLQGLSIAEPFFGSGCIILVDDTNWEDPKRATLDFVAKSSYQYRTLLDINTEHNCHPTVWNGVLILQRID